METYQRTIFAIVRGGFVAVPIFALLIAIATAFDRPLRGDEIGAAAFIILGCAFGYFMTRFIQRLVLNERP